MAYSFKDLKAEYRVMSSGDAWGEAMGWWFAIADEIHFNREFPVPPAWQFRPSPIGPSNEPDNMETEMVQGATDEALQQFGALIHRYAECLKRHGHSY